MVVFDLFGFQPDPDRGVEIGLIRRDTPWRNREQIFPKLTSAQIARIAPFARERAFGDGERICTQGDRNRPLLVVVEGGIEIHSGSNAVVTVHETGGFSGDVDLLSGRPVVVGARARGAPAFSSSPRSGCGLSSGQTPS